MFLRFSPWVALWIGLSACSGSRVLEDAGLDGSSDAFFDATSDVPDVALDVAFDVLADVSTDVGDGSDAAVPRDCAPLLAADAVPAADSPREHWLDRLDLVAPRALDAETRSALESEGVLECRHAIAGDDEPVFYRLRLFSARDLASLRVLAVELATRHPTLAITPTARPNVRPTHRADSELPEVAGEGNAIEPSMLAPHGVQGMFDYFAGAFFYLSTSFVQLGVIDEPVDTTTYARELGEVVDRSEEAITPLVIDVTPADAAAQLRRDAAGRHGNEIAAMLFAVYDGEVDRRLGPVVFGSGVTQVLRIPSVEPVSFVSPALVSFALRPDAGGTTRVSELEAAYAIVLAACARVDVVNASWGDVPGLPRALEILLRSEACRDTLFVVAAPNTSGFVAPGMDESTADAPNLLGVTSTQLGGHVHHPDRPTGSEFLAAASDAGNSYAAAVVSGVAALMRSVERDSTPESTRARLLRSAIPNDAGDHVLDASAAMLAALSSRTSDGPNNRARMQHAVSESLSATVGRSPVFTGTRESGSDWWRIPWHAGAVEHTTVEHQADALVSADPELAGRRFWSRLKGGSGYVQRLRMEEDATSTWEPRRLMPVLELGREGAANDTLSGQLLTERSSGTPRAELTTYCHVPSRTEISGDGVRIPLAMQSVLPAHTLTVRNGGTEWLVFARTEQFDEIVALPEPHELDVCGLGPMDAPSDNEVDFDAWYAGLAGDPPIVTRDVVDEIYARVQLAPLACTLEVTRVETRWRPGAVMIDIPQQTLDVDFTWGTSTCTVAATYDVRRVRRTRLEAGGETFERIEVEVSDFARDVAWDPRDGHLGALDALLHVDGAGDVLPGGVPTRLATTSHSVVGIAWGMPDLRWAPGIGPVAPLDPMAPEVTVTLVRGTR